MAKKFFEYSAAPSVVFVAAWRVLQRMDENEHIDSSYNEEDETTCCHRATFCNPRIREIIVTDPIFTFYGQSITWALVFWLATIFNLTWMSWATLYFLFGDTMAPGGECFGLFVLIIFAYLLGQALAQIPFLKLPPLFGMLLAGMIMRNADWYNIHDELGEGVAARIRTFCLTFVMIRAGLQLTTTALRNHARFMILLACLPCVVEMLVLGLCFRYLLQFPWAWAFMTGAIMASMSTVVTVNYMLALAEHGYGEDKGFATILSTAAVFDDVLILFLFSPCFSTVFQDYVGDKKWWSYIPFYDIFLGLFVGLLLGTCLAFIPHRHDKYAIWYRIVGLVVGSLMCTTATLGYVVTGGGYFATLVMSFTAITGWKILSASFDTTVLRQAAHILWHLVQPILLGVIGANIDIRHWSASRFGLHVACTAIGLTARTISVLLATLSAPFNWKERLFVALAWLPKGSLQAALAPMAFEQASTTGSAKEMELALEVVRISVVTIVFLAPLGAIAISISGPILLNRISIEEHQKERRLSYLRILSLQPVRTRRHKAQLSTISSDTHL